MCVHQAVEVFRCLTGIAPDLARLQRAFDTAIAAPRTRHSSGRSGAVLSDWGREIAARSQSLPQLVRQENRQGRTCKHPLGGSSEDKFSNPRVPIRAHDQKIGIPVCHMSFKHVTNAASFGLYFVDHHIDAMSRQVFRKLRTRPPGVDSLFFSHGENTNAFRFLQNRHRICDGSRGGPTGSPKPRSGCRARMTRFAFVVWQNHGWTPGAEDDGFCIPLIQMEYVEDG